MRPIPRGLIATLIAVLSATACAQGQQEQGRQGQQEDELIQGKPTPGHPVAGTYMCGPEGEIPEDTLELRDDGTSTTSPPSPPGGEPPKGAPGGELLEETWSIEGNRGSINSEGGGQKKFSVEGDRLLFDDGFVCTRKSG